MQRDSQVVGDVEGTQRRHYNDYADQHDAARRFDGVVRYRDQFLIPACLQGAELEGKAVLEAMCGSGFVTDYLLANGAEVSAFDISDRQVEIFRDRYPGAACLRASIFDNPYSDETFDVVVVAAGFHHLHPRVTDAFDLCLRWLKPGGLLCFYEPHLGSLPDSVRRLWYRLDPIFQAGEGAVDVDSELATRSGSVEEIRRVYFGGPAFLMILNGNVLRLPIGVMDRLAPFALAAESLHERVFRNSPRLTPLVACQWRKRD